MTDLGHLFLPIAENVTNQLYFGRETIIQADRGRGTLKFAATHTISILFFPRWLQTVVHPDEELSLNLESNHMETCARLLSQGLCQFMLCYTHDKADLGFDAQRFESKLIANDLLIPVAAPTPSGAPLHALPGSKASPAKHLYYSEASALGQVIDAELAQRPDAKFVQKTSSSPLAAALKSMAESSLGVAWIAGLLTEPALRDGTLVKAGDDSWSIPVQIRMFRTNGSQSKAAENFWKSVPCLAAVQP